jgi:hypothetical protein
MFEAIAEPRPSTDDWMPDDDFDGAVNRLLAAADEQPEWIPDHDDGPPLPTFGTCEPSG